MKIIAFPFAGGNQYSYRFFEEELKKNGIKILTIEYPGRGSKMKISLEKDIFKIVQNIMPQVISEILDLREEEPYFFYGHSMGGLMAYLVAVELSKTKLKPPLKLITSARCAPKVKYNRGVSQLKSSEFWEIMKKMGGTPSEIFENEMLREYFEPIIKSDYLAVESYKYLSNKPLDYPIDVFYGSDDIFSKEEMSQWENETNKNFTLKELNGGHFFIFNYTDFFISHFKESFLEATVN